MFYPLINTRLLRASIPLKPAPDIDWCPFRLHRCSLYNHRTTFRNHSPRASTSINTRLRKASFPLKPAPDIVWCPFPLRHTRNQHGLSAITTHLVSIVNAYKVYNNDSLARKTVKLNIFYCKTIQRDWTQVISNIMKSSPLKSQTITKGTVVITTFFIHI